MPEYLRPTPRPSRFESLTQLYGSVHTRANIPVDTYTGGIRSHLLYNSINSMAWGLSARAGAPYYNTTNRFQDTQYQRSFQPNEFTVGRQRGDGTSFNGYAQQYARNAYSHDNTPYSY